MKEHNDIFIEQLFNCIKNKTLQVDSRDDVTLWAEEITKAFIKSKEILSEEKIK